MSPDVKKIEMVFGESEADYLAFRVDYFPEGKLLDVRVFDTYVGRIGCTYGYEKHWSTEAAFVVVGHEMVVYSPFDNAAKPVTIERIIADMKISEPPLAFGRVLVMRRKMCNGDKVGAGRLISYGSDDLDGSISGCSVKASKGYVGGTLLPILGNDHFVIVSSAFIKERVATYKQIDPSLLP